ncbi:hypothetical protein M9Y10_003098 [Tritrichomonas musculus]|uniref:F-box domain-containing protein n=1 Tax=Tritrichomonas musculus TaxID=1915356 RepID=A0ABR2JNV6_9EUKA
MRFYTPQIHSCGTFIAVFKKTKDVNNNNINNQKLIRSNDPIFSQIPNEMIQKIIDTFDLPEKCNDIGFILKENKDKDKEKYLKCKSKFFNLLDKYGFENLNVYQIGCLAFSYIEEDSEMHFIPSVQTFPPIALQTKKM